MRATPKYDQYRTIRSTREATGLSFGEAKSLRAKTLARSVQGRKILRRAAQKAESKRRVRERERRARNPFLRFAVDGLPAPRFNRDYGPVTPYAVVLRLDWEYVWRDEQGYWHTDRRTTYTTLTYSHPPEIDSINRTIDDMYEANLQDLHDEDSPMDDSDRGGEKWRLVNVDIDGYYVSSRLLGGNQ